VHLLVYSLQPPVFCFFLQHNHQILLYANPQELWLAFC
jgi:hypothetical protein